MYPHTCTYVDKITKTKVIVPFIFGILDLYCTKIHVLLDVCITDTEIYGKRTSILCISYLEEQALKLPTPVNAPRETQALFKIIFDSYFSTGYFPCTAAASKAKGHIKKAGSSSMGEATIAAPRKYCLPKSVEEFLSLFQFFCSDMRVLSCFLPS